MSPLRKCHFAIRERRVRGTVDCSVPGTTLRPRTPRRPIWITSQQTPMPQHPPNRKTDLRISNRLLSQRSKAAGSGGASVPARGHCRRMKRSRYGDSWRPKLQFTSVSTATPRASSSRPAAGSGQKKVTCGRPWCWGTHPLKVANRRVEERSPRGKLSAAP
jgi:hypothetical protein